MGEIEVKPLPVFAYWGWKIFVKMFYWMFHIPLSIIYWGDGKTVPPVKNKLLLKSATKLAEEIRQGKIKSEEVILAYIERIAEVEPYINAVAENRYQEAIKEAKEVDEIIESGKYSMKLLEEEKPFLGVPFTTKILLTVKGMHSTAGSLLFKDVIATDDAPTIALMKNAGAIVLATTNSAELGLGFDTINPLYGKTCNPYDTHRTPGGSSGGESALLGAAGTVIGLGNDVTGSVRVPALFTGVLAHKPSRDLVPNTGCFPSPNFKTHQYLSTGPMCRYAEDLITMMNVLTSKNTQKMKFGQPVNFKKLKIYYQFNLKDPVVQAIDKDIVNAMKEAINYFTETYGVVAEEVNIKLLSLSNVINFHLLLDDIPNLVEMMTAGKLRHLNGTLELMKFATGNSKHSLWNIMELGFGKYPIFYSDKNVPLSHNLLEKLKNTFESLLDENSVFFYPTFPFTAPHYYEMIPHIFSTCYTGVFNFLGLPATQCPLGLHPNGMPQGMQIVAKMNNDPLTLACAEELSRVFGGWIPPS